MGEECGKKKSHKQVTSAPSPCPMGTSLLPPAAELLENHPKAHVPQADAVHVHTPACEDHYHSIHCPPSQSIYSSHSTHLPKHGGSPGVMLSRRADQSLSSGPGASLTIHAGLRRSTKAILKQAAWAGKTEEKESVRGEDLALTAMHLHAREPQERRGPQGRLLRFVPSR